MSAEILRKAARLMRERAEKAEPGLWKTWGMSVMADPLGTSDVDDAIEVAVVATPSAHLAAGRRLHTGNADHIASWHPDVVLSVADLLDWAAALLDEAEHGPLVVLAAGIVEKPLEIARRYLRETEPQV